MNWCIACQHCVGDESACSHNYRFHRNQMNHIDTTSTAGTSIVQPTPPKSRTERIAAARVQVNETSKKFEDLVYDPGEFYEIENPWFGGPFGYEVAEAVAFQNPIPCHEGFHRGWWAVPDNVVHLVVFELARWAPSWIPAVREAA